MTCHRGDGMFPQTSDIDALISLPDIDHIAQESCFIDILHPDRKLPAQQGLFTKGLKLNAEASQ